MEVDEEEREDDAVAERVQARGPGWQRAIATGYDMDTAADDLAVLHRCAGCCWLFLDRSRGAGRRWCSMADCGTEAKKRRYVQRRRERRARAAARPSRRP